MNEVIGQDDVLEHWWEASLIAAIVIAAITAFITGDVLLVALAACFVFFGLYFAVSLPLTFMRQRRMLKAIEREAMEMGYDEEAEEAEGEYETESLNHETFGAG